MKWLLGALALCVSMLALAQSINCPIDNMSMFFTGSTRSEMGKLLYQYKCPNGHVTWVVK